MGKETLKQKVLEAREAESRAEFRKEKKASRNNMKSQCREGEGSGKGHSLNVYIRVLKTRMCVLEYSHCPENTAWLLSKWWSGWGHTSEQITLVCFVGCLLAGWQPGIEDTCWGLLSDRGIPALFLVLCVQKHWFLLQAKHQDVSCLRLFPGGCRIE